MITHTPGANAADTALDHQHLIDAVDSLVCAPTNSKDLQLAAAALHDLTRAAHVLGHGNGRRKVTIFGSARTQPGSEPYQAAAALAKIMGERNYTVITGGGPGIMHAGLAGAGMHPDGQSRGIGVAIDLPFETIEAQQAGGDWPLARQQGFFTRKIALVRHVHAFVAAPGGFGTMDEIFEVLTLLQTGKSRPAPIVLLETPGNRLWTALNEFVTGHLAAHGLISGNDQSLYIITDDPTVAADHISHFWSNYQGMHRHAEHITMLTNSLPDAATLEQIGQTTGVIGPVTSHQGDDGLWHLDLPFDMRHWTDLRGAIDLINQHS